MLPLPDAKVREEIFRLHIGEAHKRSDSDYKTLAQLTEGYVSVIPSLFDNLGLDTPALISALWSMMPL